CSSRVIAARPGTRPLAFHLEPRPLFRGNRIWRHAEQEKSLASVKDNDVVGFCTVRIEERPGTIRIDRVASGRPEIGPVQDFTVGTWLGANWATRPISVEDVNSNLGDRAAHHIVHARPAEGIGPFEAGNAAG